MISRLMPIPRQTNRRRKIRHTTLQDHFSTICLLPHRQHRLRNAAEGAEVLGVVERKREKEMLRRSVSLEVLD